ncbi:MAG: hypothetical protein LBF37_01620, partial [Rickettsiales bacterium]|nr:hypothetical protein [Rickettsiales bacterium]
MAGLSLKAFLKDWYRAHHFYMMPPAKRAQWLDMMGEDDYDVVTEETQDRFRDLMQSATATPPPAYDKDITIHAGNIDRIRAISGLPNFDDLYKAGDTYKFNVNNAATRDTYLRVFSPKLGDRFYYNDIRSGGQKSWGDKKSGLLLDRPYPDISVMDDAEIARFYTIVRTTLRNISDNKPEFPDPDNPPKVANFLGGGKAFEEFAIASGGNADKKLKAFAKIASSDPILMETLRNHLASRFGADYTVDTFIADLADDKIRARALNRVPILMAVLKEWNSTYSTVDASIKTKVMGVFGNSDDMDAVIRETDQE